MKKKKNPCARGARERAYPSSISEIFSRKEEFAISQKERIYTCKMHFIVLILLQKKNYLKTVFSFLGWQHACTKITQRACPLKEFAILQRIYIKISPFYYLAYLRFFQVQKDASFQVPWCLRRQTNEKFKKKLKFPSSSNASKTITVRPRNIKRLLSSGKKERRQLMNLSGAHQQGRHDCHQTRTTDHAHAVDNKHKTFLNSTPHSILSIRWH